MAADLGPDRAHHDLGSRPPLNSAVRHPSDGQSASKAEISLPALTRVDGALIIEGNDALETLSLPKLESVGRYLHLHENAKLTAVNAPVLEPPAEVEAFHNGAAQLAGLPAA